MSAYETEVLAPSADSPTGVLNRSKAAKSGSVKPS
jgi:hypothetical protein